MAIQLRADMHCACSYQPGQQIFNTYGQLDNLTLLGVLSC